MLKKKTIEIQCLLQLFTPALTYCTSTVILGSLERLVNVLRLVLGDAVCRSPNDLVFVIGLRGSEFVMSFVLGVTIAVPMLFVVAMAGGVGEMFVVDALSI